MRAPLPLRDATNTISIGDPDAVADAIDHVLSQRFGGDGYDRDLLHAAFADVGRLFRGEYPGYLACDMPYHDLRHSLDTALLMARLIDGYQIEHIGRENALGPEFAVLGVLLALFHDTGLIRKTREADRAGPEFMSTHEERGIDFAEEYLRGTSLAAHSPLALLIDATRLMADLTMLFSGHRIPIVALGHMLGTADLLSQVSDRYYVERCFFHLYPEFVLGGNDRIRHADGSETVLFSDAFDLLRKTPAFYEHVVQRRLQENFENAYRYLAVHFGDADPYLPAVARNTERLARVLDDGGFSLLRRVPVTTTTNLHPLYLTRPGGTGATP